MRLEARRACQSAEEGHSDGAGAQREVEDLAKSHCGLATDLMRGPRESMVAGLSRQLLAWISG